MPVSIFHPAYYEYLPQWQRMRDAVAGEEAIKTADNLYLPKTDGQLMLESRGKIDGGIDPKEFYKSYKQRAVYPLSVKDAIRSMMGLVARQTPEISMPSGLTSMEENATADGFGLKQLWLRVVREILITGRCALYGDVDDNGLPYIATYSAENAINWKTEDVGGRCDLTLAVFTEAYSADTDDEFSHECMTAYRVIDLYDGKLRVRLMDENATPLGDEYSPGLYDNSVLDDSQQISGIDFVPVIYAGSTDTSPDVDEIPLLSMANASLKYYQLSADYFEALHKTAFPQAWCATNDDFKVDLAGPGTLWQVGQGGQFGYLEISGSGLSETRQSMESQRAMALEAGARVMDIGVESGDARQARQNDQYATLYSIAINAAEAVETMCRYLATMLNRDPSEVTFSIDPDFSDVQTNPQLAATILQSVMAGYVSEDAYWQYLTTGKLPDRSWQLEEANINGAVNG
ncbi:hypothetical protein LMG33818_000896 [Halomonadaceae bacterium LMG 33818]|uniref:DUF4055 domain-containing protein n=1 Tax=Cernens ardua TaxID=3402176 RepID=UPI003EDBB9BF